MSTNAHAHSSANKPGSYADHVERPDATFGGIGHHFAPGIMSAPILAMTHPNFKTSCPSCGAAILWHYAGGDGNCGGCGTSLTTHPDNGHPKVA